MAHQGGLGQGLLVGGYDLGGDINSLRDVHGGNTPIPMTDITQLAMARSGGLRDGGLSFMAYFNPSTDRAHPVLRTLPTADVPASYLCGTALGDPAFCCVAKQIGYDPARGEDGSLLFTVDLLANAFGAEWCDQLTAGLRTDTGAANGTGVDLGAAGALAFGAQAYLQVTAFSGTDVTIKIQDATTLGGAYTDVAGLAFTAVTAAHSSQRLQTSNK